MTALPADGRRRLLQVFALTTSTHDGEALAALRKAQELAAQHGTTLAEALTAGAAADLDLRRIEALERDAYERGRQIGLKEGGGGQPTALTWRGVAEHCLNSHRSMLNTWEKEFLISFISRGFIKPTPKQQKPFTDIAAKCGVRTP